MFNDIVVHRTPWMRTPGYLSKGIDVHATKLSIKRPLSDFAVESSVDF